MPAWLAPLLIVPALALYPRAKTLVAAIVVSLVILMAAFYERTPGGPFGGVTLLGAHPLATLVILLSGLERGWIGSSLRSRALLAGSYLLGFAVYAALAQPMLQIHPFAANAVIFVLLTGLPVIVGRIWKVNRETT